MNRIKRTYSKKVFSIVVSARKTYGNVSFRPVLAEAPNLEILSVKVCTYYA